MQKMCLSTGWLLGTVMASGPWMSTKVAGKWGGGGRLCLSAWQPDLRTQHGQLVALSVRLPSVSSEFHCMPQDLHWQGLCQVLDGAAGCGKCSACWCVTAGVPRSPPNSHPHPRVPFSPRSSQPHLFPGARKHCSSSWGAEASAAAPLYSGNIITGVRVCYSFACQSQ